MTKALQYGYLLYCDTNRKNIKHPNFWDRKVLISINIFMLNTFYSSLNDLFVEKFINFAEY